MTYAELKFILCEYNGYDAEDYKEGVKASIEYWYDLAGQSISDADVNAYVDAVSTNVDAETCAIQKYIDLFTNGTEAWDRSFVVRVIQTSCFVQVKSQPFTMAIM